jgi:hypothetical protein
MTDDLRDRLDDMMAMLTPSPAPVEAAMRQGKRIRWRRRATAAAGLVVVIAAAAIVPSAVHFGTAPEPATTHRGVHNSVTVQPSGPHSPEGEIAQGTINGKPWRITISKPDSIGQQCFQSAGPAVGGHGPKICAQDTGTVVGAPIVFYESFPPSDTAISGAVATDVSYANVTLTDGAVLRLHPVKAWGARYVAFVAPRGTVAKVAAYSARGEIASSVPDPVGSVNFGTWYPPGQHAPAPNHASAVIGTGTFDGNAWSVRLSSGPSGECVDFGGTPGCEPYSRPAGTAIVQYTIYGGLSSAFAVFFGSAVPAVSRIAIEFPGGKTVARPVTVAGQKYWAFAAAAYKSVHWTAYNAAGQVVGAGAGQS